MIKVSETVVQIAQAQVTVQYEAESDLKKIELVWPEEEEALGNFLLSYISGLRRFFVQEKMIH